jgi:hypothetical protein
MFGLDVGWLPIIIVVARMFGTCLSHRATGFAYTLGGSTRRRSSLIP